MELNKKELEELLTITVSCMTSAPALSYNSELLLELHNCIENREELSRDMIKNAHNNYLVLNLIGRNECTSDVFKKLDNYMQNKY